MSTSTASSSGFAEQAAPIAVAAIGGNALTRDGHPDTIPEQFRDTAEICEQFCGLLDDGYRLVVCHGNGPQVGKAILRVEATPHLPYLPLDICVADTEGGMGYMIQQVLGNRLRQHPSFAAQRAVTVVTQVLVSADDDAFRNPTKPIGPFYSQSEAEEKKQQHGWSIVSDSGRGFRRVVPSPRPREIVELPVIRDLLAAGHIPIACGGGGIPVVRDAQGSLRGIAAVIDKDRAAALLASQLGASLLLLCTSVPTVYVNFGTPAAQPLRKIVAATAARHLAEGQFPPGSMGPKIEAALDFLAAGGKEVLITSPEALLAARSGREGTRIVQ